ncbi:HD domain-containing protein [bacterium]|nr:HD domain-containing protein [bacterium]
MNTDKNVELFAGDDDTVTSTQPWPVLVVDDEADVFTVTQMAIGDLIYEGRPVALTQASNTAEAKQALAKQQFAVALFDVVMDTDDAGLQLVKHLRDTLSEPQTRIIIRTGQPGTAPEWRTVADYDINGYEDKATATAQRLRTAVLTALRGFDQLQRLEQSRAEIARQNNGLRSLVETLHALTTEPADANRAEIVMHKLRELVDSPTEYGAVLVERRTVNAGADSLDLVTATDGTLQKAAELGIDALDAAVGAKIAHSMQTRSSDFAHDSTCVFAPSVRNEPSVFYVAHPAGTRANAELLKLFCQSAADVTEAADLNQRVLSAQSEMVLILSEAVEARSLETGNHVRRVGAYSRVLAKTLGLPNEVGEMLEVATPLHDIGKVSIPDEVLKKPGGLSHDEWVVMKTHAEIGHALLHEHEHPVMRAAAIVAAEHHEKWDGTGYPNKLSGDQIHIYGRITAVADVFDAISSDRVYKKAWPLDKCKEHIVSLSGKQFDPAVVKAFEACYDDLLQIRQELAD